MKKVFSILLSIVLIAGMLMILTACGDNGEKSKENSLDSGKESSKSEKSGFIEKSDETELAKVEINVFNKMFKTFEGTEKNANDVNALIDKILASNSANPNKLVTIEINGEVTSDSAKIEEIRQVIVESKEYSISFKYNSNGLIDTAVISAN